MITKHRTYGPVKRSRLNLMGIRFMTEPNPDGAGAGGDAAAQAAAAAAAAASAAPAGAPAGSDAPWTKENFDPERAQKLVENLRGDLVKQKTSTDAAIAAAVEQAQKSTLAEFAKLLTGAEAPETDPVKLAATIAEKDTALTAAQTAVTDAQRIAQVAVHGGPLGANIAALLADPAFKTSLASVDPSKEADIKSAITQALQANAALKQPPRSSGDLAPTGPTVQSLEAQLKAAEEKKDQGEIIRLTRAVVHARQRQA